MASSGLDPASDLERLSIQAQRRWFKPVEICDILRDHWKFQISREPPNRPPSGSFFLFDRKSTRNFRKDGHIWTKRPDGKAYKEAHEKLKVEGDNALHCRYNLGEENKDFRRRIYWMLDKAFFRIAFVHYLEAKDGRTSNSPSKSSTPYHTKEPSRNADSTALTGTHPSLCQDMQQPFLEAQHGWLQPADICEILRNYQESQISAEPPNRPPSGSVFLFNRKVLRYFRKDGHNWSKKKDGKTLKEAHVKLKVGSVDVLHCCYAHGEENENFQRCSYWMLEQELTHIVFVHYLEEKKRKADGPANNEPLVTPLPPAKRLHCHTYDQEEAISQSDKQAQQDRNSQLETKNLQQDRNPIEKSSSPGTHNLRKDADEKQQEIGQVYAVYKEIDSGSTHSLYAVPVRPPSTSSSSSQELDPVLKFKNVFSGSRIVVWGSRIYMFGGVADDELPVEDQELSMIFDGPVYKRTWKKDVFCVDFSQLPRRSCAATPTPCAPMNGGKFWPCVIPVDVGGRTKICVFNADLGDALLYSGRPNFELYDPDSDTWTALPEPIDFDQGHNFALGVGGESSFRIKEHSVFGSLLFIFIPHNGIYAIDCNTPLGRWNHCAGNEAQGLVSNPISPCKLYASESALLAFDGEPPSIYKQLIWRENSELSHERTVFEGNVIDYATCCPEELCNLEISKDDSVVSLVLKISHFKEMDKGNAAAGSFSQVSETSYALRCLSPQDEGCLVGCFICSSVPVC